MMVILESNDMRLYLRQWLMLSLFISLKMSIQVGHVNPL